MPIGTWVITNLKRIVIFTNLGTVWLGVNLGKMKNGEEKSEEKIILVVVWLRREKREDYNRV